MPGPNLELDKPNIIGGLDKLVTNFAIAAIAVIPTFLTCIVKPWKLAPMLARDEPDGRSGMLLAPGAYFPLALLVSFLAAAMLATPEIIEYNGAFIGPDLAVSVQTAAAEGDVWKIIATIMPLYGTAVIYGLLAIIVKPFAGDIWTLRVSLRAAFYIFATLVSWMVLVTAIVDILRFSTANLDIGSKIYPVLIVPTAAFIPWTYFWYFRQISSHSVVRCLFLALSMLGLIMVIMGLTDLLIRLK
jgi:hypothetical protein